MNAQDPRNATVAMNGPYRSEFGGLYGDNATAPDGSPRRLRTRELAREMRRAGLGTIRSGVDRASESGSDPMN